MVDGKKAASECGAVPNVVLQSRLLEWAGIYFGEEETYALSKSLAVGPKKKINESII